jgi:hypothetical protein
VRERDIGGTERSSGSVGVKVVVEDLGDHLRR